jgi:hypothetical protein
MGIGIWKRLFALFTLISIIVAVSGIVFAARATAAIWSDTAIPGLVDSGPDSPVELGVKFRSDTSGYITSIRFYKASTNTGTHIGNLWTGTGTLLASAAFNGETASGWQQVNFSSPVAVTAGTIYVASYHTDVGHYSVDQNYFTAGGVDNPPLHAIADGVSGFNGVYAYGSTSNFPSQGYLGSNYWVDVVFSPATTATLTSVSVTPTNPAIPVGSMQQFTATGTYSDGSTQNITGLVTWTSSNSNVATISSSGLATGTAAGSSGIDATLNGVTGSTNLTIQALPLSIATSSLPSAGLNTSYTTTLTVAGGTQPYAWSIAGGTLPPGLVLNASTGIISGTPTTVGNFSFTVQVTDSDNPQQTASKDLSISVAEQASYTIWPGTTVPGLTDGGPDSPVELGVKFRSDMNGYITGIRFYKASTNTGTHTGNLWTADGKLLATATFTGETTSGWQQVNFSSPVAVTAGTVYVASYHTDVGHYSVDQNYFTSGGTDNAPLHALADGVSGFNGVYAYGSTSNFPGLGYLGSNYWVDVVFSTATTAALTSISVTPANPAIPVGSTQQFTATGTYSDGSSQNITDRAIWSSSNTAFATIDASGLATAASSGAAAISASLNGISDSTILTVNAQAAVPEPDGWYAGDMHVHRSCGGAPEDISSIYSKMTPQNLSFVSLLADMGNGEVQDPAEDLPRVTGQDDPVSTSGRTVHWDAEWHWDATYTAYPHQALGGHIVALGVSEAHQIWEEYTYPIFQWAHQAGGIAGFAHMEYLDNGIPQNLSCCTPIEYPVETALGASDFISLDVTDSTYTGSDLSPESAIQAYYRLLNCGFRPGLAAGTDYPCNFSRPVGSLLTYVQVPGGEPTYREWIDGIAKGKTVISRNGHNEFLDLKVNGSAAPGDEVNLTAAGTVQVTVVWTANQEYSGTIELVQNGMVVASKPASVTQGVSATLSATIDFQHSGWLAARRTDGNGFEVHTAAVFVTVNGEPVRASAEDAQFYVQWMDNLLEKTSPGGAWSSYFVNSRDVAQSRYQAARDLYQQIALEAAMLLNITSQSLPDAALNDSYTTTVTAVGGTAPYIWSIVSGALPPGLSLNSSNGVISGTPANTGIFNFTVQIADSASPQKVTSKALSITVSATQSNFSIWSDATVPGLVDAGPDSPVELGVKFSSDTDGYIKGIRFYKASTNTGTHVGNLWTGAGTLLATATFTGETSSGWQQVYFSTPVAVTAGTVYVASYHTDNGHYSADLNYFTGKGADNIPLHALASGMSGINGVYAYGSTSNFPNLGWNDTNYWVDVVMSGTPPPAVTLSSIAVTPAGQTIFTGAAQQFTAYGTYSDGSIQNLTDQIAWTSSNTSVATIDNTGSAFGLAVGISTISATLNGITGSTGLTVQAAPLAIGTTTLPGAVLNAFYTTTLAAAGGAPPYYWTLVDGSLPSGLSLDGTTGTLSGTPAAAGTFNFSVQVADSGDPQQTVTRSLNISSVSGMPILLISSASNPFSKYNAEILRSEGLNEFAEIDISSLSAAMLVDYDVVILGEVSLTTSQVAILGDWVNNGGNLIALRPDKKLASLLGLTDGAATLSNAYLMVDTSSRAGSGIVGQSMQFHGDADLYVLNGAASLATIYSDADTPTSNPAVTLNSVGTNGGQAAAFTYDLARSVVYTREGNPAWAGQDRDGDGVIRSDDLFYGDANFDPRPDWVDPDKVAIPQADEQQRLLANLVILMNMSKNPLPRFWYLPRNLAAAVVMTGDDHAYGNRGTAGRFDSYEEMSAPGCSFENWECIRGTSYVFTDTDLTQQQAIAYNAAGFEVALHIDTDCSDWIPSSLESIYSVQLAGWSSKFIGLPSPVTNRTHCVTWSDYATQPAVELAHGIRLDTTYYYYPSNWVADHPGLFTGSGFPMRFADANGNLIDVYQATTQMTDESGQSFPMTVDALLDKAVGPEGYYGVFTVNAHTDDPYSAVSDAVVHSAQTRGIPVITARQLLTWLDGRNASGFSSFTWDGNTLSFTVNDAQGANGLTAMVPVPDGQAVSGITGDGIPVAYTVAVIKGIPYARFSATSGAYRVTYILDNAPPSVVEVTPASGSTGVDTRTQLTAVFSEAMDQSTVNSDTFELRDSGNNPVPAAISYNGVTKTATLSPMSPLVNSMSYAAVVKGGTNGVKDIAGNFTANDFSWSFTTADQSTGPFSLWPSTTVPGTADGGPDDPVELGVKFRSDVSGYITGILFYKAGTNSGVHVGNLWSSTGTLLASATFTDETASGWQQVNFSTPVAIAANTVYVASYHAESGHYSDDQYYFSAGGMDNPPLHALADGVSGLNGVYAYGAAGTFPNEGWNGSNYWVDVVFQP